MRSISIEAGDRYNQALNLNELIKDPLIQKFLDEYGKKKAIPLFMRLIEQGRAEGAIYNTV